jgi:hypothetical protein
MAAQRGPFVARSHVPQLDGLVAAAGDERLAVGGKRRAVNGALVTLEDDARFA